MGLNSLEVQRSEKTTNYVTITMKSNDFDSIWDKKEPNPA